MRNLKVVLIGFTALAISGCDLHMPSGQDHRMLPPETRHPIEPVTSFQDERFREFLREISDSYHPRAGRSRQVLQTLETVDRAIWAQNHVAASIDWPIDESGYLNFENETELYAFFDSEAQFLETYALAWAGPNSPLDPFNSFAEAKAIVKPFPYLGLLKNDLHFEWKSDSYQPPPSHVTDEGLIYTIPVHHRTTRVAYPTPIGLNCENISEEGWVKAWATHYYAIPQFPIKLGGNIILSPPINRGPVTSPVDEDLCPPPPEEPPPPPPPGGGGDSCDDDPMPSSPTEVGMASFQDCGDPGGEICEWTEWGLFVWINGEWWLVESWWEYECGEPGSGNFVINDDAAQMQRRNAPSMKVVIVPDEEFPYGDVGSTVRRGEGPPVVFLRESEATPQTFWEACRGLSRWEARMEDPSYRASGLSSLRASWRPPARSDASTLLDRARNAAIVAHSGMGTFPTLPVQRGELERIGCWS